jgi:hypothetical protein
MERKKKVETSQKQVKDNWREWRWIWRKDEIPKKTVRERVGLDISHRHQRSIKFVGV